MPTSSTTPPTRPTAAATATTQQTQNDHPNSSTRTTRAKITEQYTPRHHDLLVILTDPAGSVGCVLCAITLHADNAVVDCGLGPEHRDCHDRHSPC